MLCPGWAAGGGGGGNARRPPGPPRPRTQRRHNFIADLRLVFGDPGHWVKGPPRDRGESTGEKDPAPELPAALRSGHGVTVTQADIAHLTSPSPGFLPNARVPEHTLPSSERSR